MLRGVMFQQEVDTDTPPHPISVPVPTTEAVVWSRFTGNFGQLPKSGWQPGPPQQMISK